MTMSRHGGGKGFMRIAAFALCFALCVTLCGCWDYKDIKKLNVVAGIAVDSDEESGGYIVSFELIDLSKSLKDNGLTPLIVQGKGKNVSEAINSVRYYLDYNLYFGSSQFLLVQEKLAREEGLDDLLDWFTREYEIKDTTYVCIANTEHAYDLFEMEPLDKSIISYEMLEILNYDKKATVFVRPVSLYKLHSYLRGEARTLTLPVFGTVKHNPEEETSCLYGMALFNGEYLQEILPVEEARYLLFAWNEKKMATLNYDLPALEDGYITVDIVRSSTQKDYSRDGRNFTFKLDICTHCSLEELKPGEYLSDNKKELEKQLADQIRENLLALLKKCQELGVDAPEFGRMVYQREPKLWKEIAEDWNELFASCSIEVTVLTRIENPGINQKS